MLLDKDKGTIKEIVIIKHLNKWFNNYIKLCYFII